MYVERADSNKTNLEFWNAQSDHHKKERNISEIYVKMPCLQEIRMRRSKREASVQRVHTDSSENGSWQPARISNFN